MPSFDIVSEVDLAEVENACANVRREIETRYDFKGSQSSVEAEKNILLVKADDDLKLKQVHEILRGHLNRRGIEPGQLDFATVEQAAGQSVRQRITVIEGIDSATAKKLAKDIKGQKFKAQVSIQGDSLRVTGKKRDDLQEVISFVKGLGLELPLQYTNFRD